ncbi:MAG TPA: hypothetical protein VG028_21935 [Terriglobia bacterium]|nr:hypothetical protein [Terriglobia bacterium]
MKLRTYAWSAAFLSLVAIILSATPSPLLAQTIQVTSAVPNTAAQGTINLNVVVGGSGYKKGAQATWFVTGTTNPGGVVVNSTAFNSSSQLTANITVSSTADLSSYDILVTNTDGRSGKGTKLFSVTSPGNPNSGCTSYNVTSILNNADTNNVPFQYQSDGLGPYTTFATRGNKDSVNSVIQGSCSWALDTTSSTSRGIVVTLAYPDSTNPPPPFVGPQEIHGAFHTTCQDDPASNGLNFGTMTFAGQTMVCPLHLPFTYNGVLYNVSMAPQHWPGTGYMQVTCTGATAGKCNAWTVQPDPATGVLNNQTNQVSAIGELFIPSCNGCGTGTPLGLYLVSFSFVIHK